MEESVKTIGAAGRLAIVARGHPQGARSKRPSASIISADHRDGEIARLELLKAELEAVFAELPRHDDRFNLVLVPSRPARLWIDLFTYAAVDDASGAYLFVRNSESGRRTLFSSNNVADIADRITRYMAQEIVRRERHGGGAWPSPAAWSDSAREPAPSGTGDGRGDRGLCHRHSHRRGRAVRGGVAQPLPEHAPLALPDMLGRRRRPSARPSPRCQPSPASRISVFVVARGGDAPLDGFRRRRHADDDGRSGRGGKFVHRLRVVMAMQHELGAMLLQHAA